MAKVIAFFYELTCLDLLIRIYLICLALCCAHFSIAQQSIGRKIAIALPDTLKTGSREISGLAIAGNRLYLLCENRRDRFRVYTSGIYSISLTELEESIEASGRLSPACTWHPLEGIDWVMQRVGDYQGLESLVIQGNRFYATVETEVTADSCYLVSGTLTTKGFKIDTSKLTALPKPKLENGSQVFNAGFEALLHRKGKLYALFEYNQFERNHALMVRPSTGRLRKIQLSRKLPFRTTDITFWKNNNFIGINYFFPLKEEFIYTENLSDAEENLIRSKDGTLRSFARLTLLKISKNRLQVVRYIDLPEELWTSNWEGIARFKNGVFLVNDKFVKEGGRETQLIYLTLN